MLLYLKDTITGNALHRFEKHDVSQSHREAVLKIACRTKDVNVSGLMSKAHEQERQLARTALLKIVTLQLYLCKQGLAIRGHTESTGNFDNLLLLRAEDNAELKSWLNRSSYKWTSLTIQNEIIKDMALAVLRTYKEELIKTQFFSIMLDKSTDVSVHEQVSICFRYVSNDLSVHEVFDGFYETTATDAGTLYNIVQDVLKRFDMSLANCRGQCFDGASNISGHVTGLQKRIRDIEPRAKFIVSTTF